MNLADLWYVSKYENVSILAPEKNTEYDYKRGIIQTIDIFKSNGIDVPPHTVLIFPIGYSSNESPVSYPPQHLVMIFPLEYVNLPRDKYVMFQYLHELGHLITGAFDQPNKWVGELLACSCNYFFFPKDTSPNSFYELSIANQTLSLAQNQANYKLIQSNLCSEQYLVYNGSHPIKSALYAYSLEHSDFDFVSLLKEFAASKTKSKEQNKLILKIVNLLM